MGRWEPSNRKVALREDKMKKIIFILSILAISFLSACKVFPEQESSTNLASDVYKEAIDGVVYVINQNGSGNPGIGTGFFIDYNVIVTNYHVVRSWKKLKIKMKNSEIVYDAKVRAFSEKHDIAIIELNDWKKFTNEQKWNILKLESSYEIGEPVFTLGHPSGIGWTFSEGILSGDMRETNPLNSGLYVLYLQTDAKIYQGNSGGPLLNGNSDVIGINSILLEVTGGSYGFSIPSSIVKKVVYDLITYGKSEVFRLGISLKLTDDMKNIMVNDVSVGSNAEKCGIKDNDVILSVDTEYTDDYVVINNMNELVYQMLIMNMDNNKISFIISNDTYKTKTITCNLELGE